MLTFSRGPLPSGYDAGEFGADLRALILSLIYCGNMSEPKIREFLENFDVQVSAGSLSNILTNTVAAFEQEYHDLLAAGLSSTPYQQTDDTSARVRGEAWHTHILCNPFYTAYSTRLSKDRLAVLSVLQNTDDLRFRFNVETLKLLQEELMVPVKWQQAVAALGENIEFDVEALKTLLDDWFGERNKQARTSIEQAAVKKGELLTVLTIPEVPLHNNASGLGARGSARRRDVSLHSRSVRGARAMDIFPTLVQTSKKLGIGAFQYLRDRLSRRFEMLSVAQSIHQAAQSAAASG